MKDYMKWLQGYLSRGNSPTHSYDYPFDLQKDRFRVATRSFYLPGLGVASSLKIIMPEGVGVLYEDFNHCTLYYLKDFTVGGKIRCVPIFSDTEF
jgi:hypothetical protein